MKITPVESRARSAGIASSVPAAGAGYDNDGSGLVSENVQDAIDEILTLITSVVPGGDMTPYYIAPADTFTVPLYKQALFQMTIDNEGILDVAGYLVEVN